MPFTPEERRAYHRAWYQAHKAQVAEQSRNRRARPEVKAQQREYGKRYRADHPAKQAEKAKRDKPRARARKLVRLEALAGRPRPFCCELCNKPDDKRGIVFDHCHQKGHFRGWLCNRCNRVLGLVDDDPNILHQLAAYLLRHRDNQSPQLAIPGI